MLNMKVIPKFSVSPPYGNVIRLHFPLQLDVAM